MSQSNPRNANAIERQLVHEAEHNQLKYDKDGKRKAHTLPPEHERGARILPVRNRHGH
jgi:hypothetical protein